MTEANYDSIQKFPHPVHQNYEVHLLPHLRVYNKTEGCYISQKNDKISIPVKKATKYNLPKFCLECKNNQVVEKNKEVKLVDKNNPITFENLKVVDKEKEKDEAVIVTNENQPEVQYKSVKEASKATGVKVPLIRYCCDALVNAASSRCGWISFRWAD